MKILILGYLKKIICFSFISHLHTFLLKIKISLNGYHSIWTIVHAAFKTTGYVDNSTQKPYTSKIGLNLHRTYITTNESSLKFGNIYNVLIMNNFSGHPEWNIERPNTGSGGADGFDADPRDPSNRR